MEGPALPSSPNGTPQFLTETGSTQLFPLFAAWSQAYQNRFRTSAGAPAVAIATGGTGSGTGISEVASGTVDIGTSDVYLSGADAAKSQGLLNIALALSAQQVNYNLPGVKHLNLDGTVLAEIYTGKVTRWNAAQIKALNPGARLPAMKIITVHRSDNSGDTFLFTSYLHAQDPSAWPASNVRTQVTWPSVAGALSEAGDGAMTSACAATKGCIAYASISEHSASAAAGLGTASIKNASGAFLQPSPATITAAATALAGMMPVSESMPVINGPAADGYPIVNYEYAIVRTSQPDGAKAEDIRAVLNWIVHAGQSQAAYLHAVNFEPLPAGVVKLSDKQIARIGS